MNENMYQNNEFIQIILYSIRISDLNIDIFYFSRFIC